MTDLFKTHSLALKDDTTKTIASGVITADQMYHVVAAQTGTTDDLDTINIGYDTVTINSLTYRPLLMLVADAGDTITLKHSTGNIELAAASDVAITGNDHILLFYDGVNWVDLINSVTGGGATAITAITDADFMQARLTLTTAIPVTTADVTAATNIYWTPYGGNLITLYDGADWKTYIHAERTLAVAATTNTMYDIFGYISGGATAIEALAWTNDTTRATALAVFEGRLTKSGDNTRRYLGSYRTTGVSGQTEDSDLNRLLFNYYNRKMRRLFVYETTDSWTYATAAWRSLNNSTANRVTFVQGWDEERLYLQHGMLTTAQQMYAGIALDATNTTHAALKGASSTAAGFNSNPSIYQAYPGIGYHYLQLTEYANAATPTAYGDNGVPTLFQTGGLGHIWA